MSGLNIETITGKADEREALLAKVLAAENISVVFSKDAKTASFDVNERVLCFPTIEAPLETRFLFVFHEVSHALFTPPLKEEQTFSLITNVLEDVRVDKKILMKYPGARRFYSVGLAHLADNGFFGEYDVYIANPTKGNFVNRVNTYSKIRYIEGDDIPSFEEFFPSEAERKLFHVIDSTITFDDVIEAERLVREYLKSDKNNNQSEVERGVEHDWKSDDQDVKVQDNSSNELSEGSGNEQQSNEDEERSEDSSLEGSGDESKSENNECSGGSSCSDDSESKELEDDDLNIDDVEDFYEKALKKISNPTIYEETIEVGKFSIVDSETNQPTTFNTLYDLFYDHNKSKFNRRPLEEIVQDSSIRSTMNSIKKVAGNMAKEFLLRKRSRDYGSRNHRSTGIIDPNMLASYKFTEDIFKQTIIEKKGKNYGLVLVIDCSDSMDKMIWPIYQQVALLAEFSRQVGISFRAFGYTNYAYYSTNDNDPVVYYGGEDKTRLDVSIMELISTDMNKKLFAKSIQSLVAESFLHRSRHKMGGTPTYDTMMVLGSIVDDWRIRNNVDICKTFLFTDGASASSSIIHGNDVSDTVTKKHYFYNSAANTGEQNSLYYSTKKYQSIVAYDIYKSRSNSLIYIVGGTDRRSNVESFHYFIDDFEGTKIDLKILEEIFEGAKKKNGGIGIFRTKANNHLKGVVEDVMIVFWKSREVSLDDNNSRTESLREAMSMLKNKHLLFLGMKNLGSHYVDMLR